MKNEANVDKYLTKNNDEEEAYRVSCDLSVAPVSGDSRLVPVHIDYLMVDVESQTLAQRPLESIWTLDWCRSKQARAVQVLVEASMGRCRCRSP